MIHRFALAVVLSVVALKPQGSIAGEEISRQQAHDTLRRAVGFFREEVSAEGAYLWRYSADLTRREGEGAATPSMGWVQPPGTPTVGEGYLQAYELCGEPLLLEAARETAHALVKCQLLSGGWDYRLEMDPQKRPSYAFRVEPADPKGFNTTTFDDDTTQSALRFLMHIDRTLEFKDDAIHEAVGFALASILKVQYPNGAWPQRYREFPDPANYPVKQANYPESWSRTFPKEDYRGHYTFNDGSIADVIALLFEAGEIYGDGHYRKAAEKGGDFILLAQMPEPQPGWAQQYNADMQPAWARKFEPPSITGGESRDILRTLMLLYRETGNRKYLEPLPRAIAYYRKSELSGGRLARFYELKTNKPLYFTKEYELTYSDADLPTHYGFIVGSWVNGVEEQYQRLLETPADTLKKPKAKSRPTVRMSPELAAQAKSVIDAMDRRGAWVVDGTLHAQGANDDTRRIIDTRTFVNNVGTLARFLAASDAK